MEVYLIYHTDIWQTYTSFRLIGAASSYNKAIDLTRKDKDAMYDVQKETGT